MSTALLLLIAYVGAALSISFVCSILEAALLSSRVIELAARRSKGDRNAALLLDIKQNRIDEAISAILTLNTIAHTIGAAMAGAQAAIVFGDAWVGVFSGVLTLLVLVITEIIPKTLGTVFASQLVGFVGRTIRLLIIVLWPVLRVTSAITGLFVHKRQHQVSRAELTALVNIATSQGTLDLEESKVFDNVLRLNDIRVSDVMTPRTVAVMLPASAPVRDILAVSEAMVFSRLPLFEGNRDNVVGYVLQRDVLAAIARDCDASEVLSRHRRDCMFVPENAPLAATLRDMLKRREHMAVVADEFGAVEGLGTLEDLIETVLGVEIVDEVDRVADMREQALRLRETRMKRREVVRDD
jgi:CBS domain containing-hemolysin-like protein